MDCTYCNRKMHTRRRTFDGLFKTRDHYIPLSKGGSNTKENIRMACYRCNNLKGNMMPEAWERFMAENPVWWDSQINVKAPVAKEALPVFHELSRFPKESGYYKRWLEWRAERGLGV